MIEKTPKLKKTLLELVLIRAKIKDCTTDWHIQCCTCSYYWHRSSLQWGHFIPQSKWLSTKFELDNVNAQCAWCNGRANQWEQYLHGKYIDQRYWIGRADQLRQQANQIRKRKSFELFEEITNLLALIYKKYQTFTPWNKEVFLEYIKKAHRKQHTKDLLLLLQWQNS